MPIQSFLNNIPGQIIERGEAYFDNGAILDLNRVSAGFWQATVEGNYGDYDVDIKLDNNEDVIECFCNCPYEDICKHIVAVLLAIDQGETIEITAEPSDEKLPLSEIIENTEVDILRKFVTVYAANNPEFGKMLRTALSEKDEGQSGEEHRKIVERTLNFFSDGGYTHYNDVFATTMQLDRLIGNAQMQIGMGKFTDAFQIATAIIDVLLENIEYVDDSDDDYGGKLMEAFELISSIVESGTNPKMNQRIHEWVLEVMEEGTYFDYCYEDQLTPLALKASVTPEQISRFHKLIDDQIEKLDKLDNWSSSYMKEIFLNVKLDLFKKENKLEQAEKLISQNLYLNSFRQKRVDDLLLKSNYGEAVRLVKEGRNIAKKENLPGVVIDWNDQLLDIYKTTNETAKMGKLARTMFLQNPGMFNYFEIYKKSIPESEWPQSCEEIIKNLEERTNQWYGGGYSTPLADIFVEEEMWDRLFHLVKDCNAIEVIINYTDHLKQNYSTELIDIYRNAILKSAEQTGRRVYRDLVRYLKIMSKLKDGRQEASKLKDHLLEQYRNRPAMKDEFSYLKL